LKIPLTTGCGMSRRLLARTCPWSVSTVWAAKAIALTIHSCHAIVPSRTHRHRIDFAAGRGGERRAPEIDIGLPKRSLPELSQARCSDEA
jgi:hypothetical protein